MKAKRTKIADLLLIEPTVYDDPRGSFMETWNRREFSKLGIDAEFVQDNQSRSGLGVVRGLHFQIEQPQGKLVRVVNGAAYDVAVDLRRSSPTFGQTVGVQLSTENGLQLWIPPGFAHGFMALADNTDVIYKCTDYYAPAFERTLAWDDPALGIDWPNDIAPRLSARDEVGFPLNEIETFE